MKQKFRQIMPYITAVLLMVGAFSYVMCSASHNDHEISARTLAESNRIKIDDLTVDETIRLDVLLNREVSPCGNNLSLGQSLQNPAGCPLARHAGGFILELLKQDYNADEISKRYMGRYAAVKGLTIPVDGAPRFGPPKASVTIVVFSDFECPFCSRTAKDIEKLAKSYPDDVAVVFKHFPLETHVTSELAARAGFAAHQQGKFWEMHDVLFSAQGSAFDADRVRVMAIGLDLDVEKFEEDLVSDAATAALKADEALGKELGVIGTPYIFVNGRALEGGIGSLGDRIQEEFLRREYQQ